MSKYKTGDKVVMEITKGKTLLGTDYYLFNDGFGIRQGLVELNAEPLTTYTEPLEAKIRRQAAEITRLLAENKRLKKQVEEEYRLGANAEYEKWKEHASRIRAEGAEAAWELARKCMLMTDRDRENIFGSGHNALYGVLTYFDYKHAAAKVEAWEKAKEETKRGDIIRNKYDTSSKFCVTDIGCDGHLYGVGRYGLTYSNKNPEDWEKTGRHIDIDSFLKQIGEE